MVRAEGLWKDTEDATEYRTVTVVGSEGSSFETPAWRDTSLGLSWVESSELAAAE
jgi:hypothetical protein